MDEPDKDSVSNGSSEEADDDGDLSSYKGLPSESGHNIGTNRDVTDSDDDKTCVSYRVDTVSNISYVSGMNRSAFSQLNRHVSSNVSERSCLISEVSAPLDMRGIPARRIETSSESDSQKELIADNLLEEVKIDDRPEQ